MILSLCQYLNDLCYKTIKETSEIYSISRKTIIEWKKLKKQTGDVKAKSGDHTGHRRIIRDIEGFKKFIDKTYAMFGSKYRKDGERSCCCI
ncbi:hypothetical protein [Rickettsia endosymbiont of Gonocerus acuteangulatus]|uniref:hypothetical protein n=1 Tax=Rickettsia endosymbiont of Gonocerus acuteangulatus TaxID=3066266 RepID=UPI0031332C73